MSPSILKADEVSTNSNFDLQNVEAKADTLQAKVDALLLEVGQPSVPIEENASTETTEQVAEEKEEAKKE
ncbi:unnamed protein product [Mucor hiemalis]